MPATERPPLRATVLNAWQLARPFWISDQRASAIGILSVIVILNLGLVAIAVLLTYWQRAFFNALERKDWPGFIDLLLSWHLTPEGSLVPGFAPILSVLVIFTVYALYLQQGLFIRWRSWMTENLMSRWLSERVYYLINLDVGVTDNPDQRIAEDIKIFVDESLNLGLGFTKATVALASFVVLLWSLSDAVKVFGITIPGYLVWLSLLYAGLGTLATHYLGRRLIGLNFLQQKAEADFRFGLVRVRESSENIAFYDGAESEKQTMTGLFHVLMQNWRAIMIVTKRMTFFTSAYTQAALVFPLVIVAPAYFAGRMPLGGIFQTANAFVQVQTALSWFIENYTKIAEWSATVNRLHGFKQAMEVAENHERGPRSIMAEIEGIEIEALTLALPDGRQLLSDAELSISPGQHLAMTGPSGAGKSTFLRTVAGLWPCGSGSVRQPDERRMFLPQKPYMPIGTLRSAVSYPEIASNYSTEQIAEVLADVGLGRLSDALDEHKDWANQLSGGELQRVALARALLFQPRWLFLDEATANLDEGWERRFFTLIQERLPDATLISVTHRSREAQTYLRTVRVENGKLIEDCVQV